MSPSPSVYLCVCRSVGRSVCPESVLWQIGWMDPDAVWDGEWGRSRDGCIRWVVIVEGEGAVLGWIWGIPLQLMGTLLCSCAAVQEPIKLLFDVVSGVLISDADRLTFGHSSKASRVPWNKVTHWKVSLGRMTWWNKSTGGNLIVIQSPREERICFCHCKIKSQLMIIHVQLE